MQHVWYMYIPRLSQGAPTVAIHLVHQAAQVGLNTAPLTPRAKIIKCWQIRQLDTASSSCKTGRGQVTPWDGAS